MKRILSRTCLLLFTLLLLVVFTVGVTAQSRYINDGADLLSDSAEQTLAQRAQQIRIDYGYDVAMVTLNGLSGMQLEDYADSYYDNGDYAWDAVLLFVDMQSREIWILTNGEAATVFNDGEGLEKLFDSFYDLLGSGDYEQAFLTYYNEADSALALNQSGQIYADGYVTEYETDYGKNSRTPGQIAKTVLIGIGIGVVIAGIIFAVCLHGMKTARSRSAAGEYVRPGSFALTHSSDLYLYTTTTRTRIQSNSGSSGGRSGGSRGGGGRSF